MSVSANRFANYDIPLVISFTNDSEDKLIHTSLEVGVVPDLTFVTEVEKSVPALARVTCLGLVTMKLNPEPVRLVDV
jgi:hypothetical protein